MNNRHFVPYTRNWKTSFMKFCGAFLSFFEPSSSFIAWNNTKVSKWWQTYKIQAEQGYKCSYRYSTYRHTVIWIKGRALLIALHCHKHAIPFQTGSIHAFETVLLSILNKKKTETWRLKNRAEDELKQWRKVWEYFLNVPWEHVWFCLVHHKYRPLVYMIHSTLPLFSHIQTPWSAKTNKFLYSFNTNAHSAALGLYKLPQ